MISYLNGKIILKKENFAIVEVAGVGYEVFFSAYSMRRIPEAGQSFKLFCYLDVQERALKLYGFLTYEELELFRTIKAIQGVGPRASLEISGFGSLDKIKTAIEKGNAKIFESLSGIGEKKAKKIILELSGKIKNFNQKPKKEKDVFETDEVFLALLNLGFSKDQAKAALSQLPPDVGSPQEKIKQALRFLGG